MAAAIEERMLSMICVGYSRVDFTPDFSVPLAGYGNTHKRMSQGWYNRIYATGIAITDSAGQTLLLLGTDQIRCVQAWTNAARERITKATGIPGTHIMLAAIHSHSAPDIGAGIKEDHPYYEQYLNALTQAAVEAMADRAEATLSLGRTTVPKMCFVRHYRMKDGGVVGDNFGNPTGREFAGHTMDADEEMQLIRFDRVGKKPVLMINWQAHPTVGSTSATESGRILRPFLGSDYIGACRDRVEAESDCLFVFFQGAAGNLNSRSRMVEETPTDNVHEYGQQLAGFVLDALGSMQPAQAGELVTRRHIYEGELDHTEDHLLEQAKEIRKIWADTNNSALCAEAGEKYGIHSTYHAGAIMARAAAGTTFEMELNAIGLGDISFITAPYEMFCNSAQAVKANTPYPMTFVLSCANSGAAYIASTEAFDHGCYEVDNRKFVRGTAEKAVSHFLEMLKDLKK